MKKLSFLFLVAAMAGVLLLSAGCRGTSGTGAAGAGEKPGYGNGVNGGLVCTDGRGGIYFAHPLDGGLMHRTSDGKVSRIENFADVSQLIYSDGKVYFSADHGMTDEQMLIEPGIYVYNGADEKRLTDGYILNMSMDGDRLYYTDGEGAYALSLGGEKTTIRQGDIRQIVPYGDGFYLFEMQEETGAIVLCDQDGHVTQEISADCSGGLNVTGQCIYYFGNEGVFSMPHGQGAKCRQIIFADGVRGLNATENGLYYISSSLGEPSLNLYQSQQSKTVIAPSVLGQIESGPFIVGETLYWVADGQLLRADADGGNIERIPLE